MASVLRVGGRQLMNTVDQTLLNTRTILPAVQQVCFISGKNLRAARNIVRPKPYDYINKRYGLFNSFFDRTTQRMDENSKVIVVDGPIAAGKTKFAKELAEELDMHYVPDANMDSIYINSYGEDLRKLDPMLPEACKSFDIPDFCRNPNHLLCGQLQMRMLLLRYELYIDAIAHLLSTGQGVVLDRSVFSNFVFLEAMRNSNYVSKGVKSVYYDAERHSMPDLIKPHLIIYLDVPVDIVKKRIKERGHDYEVNSKALTDKYLQDIDTFYKQQFLKKAALSSEILVYDWSNGGETELVVEDIERIDFNRFDHDDPKLRDWRQFPHEYDWCALRMKYTVQKPDLMNNFNLPRFDVPELTHSGADAATLRKYWFNAPGNRFIKGYNKSMGDKGILFKWRIPNQQDQSF